MEEGVVTRFLSGSLRHLFDKRGLITNYPGSGNNWAEGYFCHGPEFRENIVRTLTHFVETCDSLHGFLLIFSMGGGTGSGLGSYILELLADSFPNVERFVACVYPTGTEDVITAPYNMMLGTQALLEHATCVFPVENRALLNITSSNKYSSYNVCLDFADINSIIVDMLLHLTSGSRFLGSLNFDMNEINTNMVPFPKLKFLSSSFCPLQGSTRKIFNMSSKQFKDEVFWNACSRSFQLIKMDPLDVNSVILAGTLIGRGAYSISDMRQYVDKLQRKAQFTNWSSKAIKMGLCSVPPEGCNFSMLSLFNTSSVTKMFDHISDHFHRLLDRKAHVHHYTNIPGFEFDRFYDCQNSIYDVIELYKEVENLEPAKVTRLSPTVKNEIVTLE